MVQNKPFLLTPVAKNYLWGGSRLNDDFDLRLPGAPLAEAWMCSTHPDGVSGVATGGTLAQVLAAHPEYLGDHVLAVTKGVPELPIMVKLIDAARDLSVQVHPDDGYAALHEGDRGKTEMWYVLDAKEDARLIYGFNRDLDAETVASAIDRGDIGKYLNRVPVRRGEVFFIESGTVHAIGAGCLIAEIQESSNVTYRLYDYDRVDRDGGKRPLHVKKALDVADLSAAVSPRQPVRVLRFRSGSASELLSRCRYFQVERFLLNTEGSAFASFGTAYNSFHVLLCVDGSGSLRWEDVELPFGKGSCVFVPADSIPLRLHGRAEFLNISC